MILELRQLGVRVALDDVGRGSSNLLSLVELEPDFIKVDRSLIYQIASSTTKQRLLKLLVTYMESGSNIIAEGVENEEDLAAVRATGVRLSQGFWWSKPMGNNELNDVLQHTSHDRLTQHGIRNQESVYCSEDEAQLNQLIRLYSS